MTKTMISTTIDTVENIMPAGATLNEWRDHVYEWARGKGWYDVERDKDDLFALLHTEVSEAFEEYRNDHEPSKIYYNDGNDKPEGVPIEIADLFIRIMDNAGYLAIDLDETLASALDKAHLALYGLSIGDWCKLVEDCMHITTSIPIADWSVSYWICLLNQFITRAWEGSDKYMAIGLVRIIAVILVGCRKFDIVLVSALQVKMAYNHTREYRHGGKRV